MITADAEPQCLVFLDTETTGLHRTRRAWEISMIRRIHGGGDSTLTIYVHLDDLDLKHAQPAGLAIGRFEQRHPALGAPLSDNELLLSEHDAVALVDDWTAGAEIYGVRPSFDTETLTPALARHGRHPRWWRDPIDITRLAWGWVLAHGQPAHRHPEALSKQCSVPVPSDELRHTAYGDADWVKRWYDTLHEPASTAAAGRHQRQG